MLTQQSVADGGRSTFPVQNNLEFPVTAIGVFSAEAARKMGIKRFDTAAAKKLLATKGMNVLRSPVTVKQGGKATLDVEFPGCREDWDALVAMTRPGSEDAPVLKYVQTELYKDPSAPVGSHHVRGAVDLSRPKPSTPKQVAPVAQAPKAAQPQTATVAEGVIRRIVRAMLSSG